MAHLAHLHRILVVEDEALILLDVEQTLRDLGVPEVMTATSAAEAGPLIETGAPDVALLDLHLGRSGWSYPMAHRLKEKGVPFAFMSGTVGIAEGFRDVPLLMKPFSSAQLIATLLQVTADRETEAAQ